MTPNQSDIITCLLDFEGKFLYYEIRRQSLNLWRLHRYNSIMELQRWCDDEQTKYSQAINKFNYFIQLKLELCSWKLRWYVY